MTPTSHTGELWGWNSPFGSDARYGNPPSPHLNYRIVQMSLQCRQKLWRIDV
uniref:Uncharacterized protein n=1 Tax=Anguilla anguilla TaxID=7936 RepID=A0A0E9VHN5_ANGAN